MFSSKTLISFRPKKERHGVSKLSAKVFSKVNYSFNANPSLQYISFH